MSDRLAYFVFDIESVADAQLISKVHFNNSIPPQDAVRKYRDELLAKNDSDFIPYTFQIPISVVIGKVAEDFSLLDVVVLDEPEYRPHEICNKFWRGWSAYKQPTFVSFNGRGFDIPMLEQAAFRYGISIPGWFSLDAKTFEQPRNRYNLKTHIDLCDILTNYGATRFNGGLNLAASILGKPGKMGTQGYMVQDLYDAGELIKINDYCRCDVLDTYFVFLRVMVLTGKLSLHDEQVLVKKTKDWLLLRAEQNPAYHQYLDSWGDWFNPWENRNNSEPHS
ncbi:MAG: 3'-5' exonuclease [Planctomycetaceae bacterium]|jgi:predicted PolB exonuclease-like 3'-5' exonuclease|nr:3'-5' exonuclease [Planctomycetaceae bacterium]